MILKRGVTGYTAVFIDEAINGFTVCRRAFVSRCVFKSIRSVKDRAITGATT